MVDKIERHHPKGVPQAYSEIRLNVYVSDHENLAELFAAMNALKSLQWFSTCVRDIRAFRIEQWSDFTGFFKS